MKKRFFTVAVASVIIGSVLFTSCMGSFGLSNKLYSWNKSVSDNKFVNELVFFIMVVVPVYEVTMFVDGIVLNSIEFWSGSNPVVGEVKTVEGEKDIYRVENLENGYKIQNTTGDEISLIYDDASKIWSVVTHETSTKLIQIVDNENAIVYLGNDKTMNVPINEAGVLALRQAIDDASYVAVR